MGGPTTPHSILLLFCVLLGSAISSDDVVSLLQSHLDRNRPSRPAIDLGATHGPPTEGARELAFVHIPANFGHTVEQVAMFGSGFFSSGSKLAYVLGLELLGKRSPRAAWDQANALTQAGGKLWGRASPDLQAISDATGCPLYSTPPKHWPRQLAAEHFGNKTVFAILRDPYERLLALARAGPDCDLNGAISRMLKDVVSGSRSKLSCQLLPQAEYFDGPHGVALPVDGRRFPASVNEVFREHGHPQLEIRPADVVHVSACPKERLEEETRSLVRQVYSRDFELLCKHFGRCDREGEGAVEVGEAEDAQAREEDFAHLVASGALGEDFQKLAADRALLRRLLQRVAMP